MKHHGRKLAIFGTPITPAALLDELDGESFCVSYATKRDAQVERCIDLVGDDGMLLFDNGAFSAFQAGQSMEWNDHWQAFVDWADDIAARCPQAVVVVPDVINGTPAQNAELAAEFQGATATEFGRTMVVWHLDEPLYMLRNWVEAGYQYIAIGSSGRFWKPGTAAWHRRVEAAFRALDVVCAEGNGYRRPHVHMMRAQGQHVRYPFDSSDSTNVAVNHCRRRHTGPGHVGRFATEVRERITATSDGEQRIESPAEAAVIAADLEDWRRTWPELTEPEPPPTAPMCAANDEDPSMPIYRVTEHWNAEPGYPAAGGSFFLRVDLGRAACPVATAVDYFGAEVPDAGSAAWSSTPLQTADGCHDLHAVARLASDYLAACGGDRSADRIEVEELDVEPPPNEDEIDEGDLDRWASADEPPWFDVGGSAA